MKPVPIVTSSLASAGIASCGAGDAPEEDPVAEDEPAVAAKIAALNDQLRKAGIGGQIVITRGVQALGEEAIREALRAVQDFDAFTADNDPHGEHDFGVIEIAGEALYWKIDYYDTTCTAGSEDPSDPTVTTRVLTIMLRSEY